MDYLLTDVDMEDTQSPPPYHEHISVAPFQPTLSFWSTSVPEKPPSTSWNSSGVFSETLLYTTSLSTGACDHWKPTLNDTSFDSVASMSHASNPLDTARNRSRDTSEAHWKEPPQHADAPHSTSVATLVDNFDRLLTLVIPSDPVQHPATPACIPLDQPVEPSPPQSLGSNKYQPPANPLRFDCSTPSPFKQERTILLEQSRDGSDIPLEIESSAEDQCKATIPDFAVQPRSLSDTAPLPTYTFTEPLADLVPHGHPRPPTPPVSRRPHKSTFSTTDTTSYSAATVADLPGLPPTSVRRRKRNQPPSDLDADCTSRLASRCLQVFRGRDRPEVCESGSGWGVPSTLKAAVDLVWCHPAPARDSHRNRKVQFVEEADCRPERHTRDRHAQFLGPDLEDESDENRGTNSPDRSRQTRGSDSTRHTGRPAPPRSILRNRPAPYDRGMARLAQRRASMP